MCAIYKWGVQIIISRAEMMMIAAAPLFSFRTRLRRGEEINVCVVAKLGNYAKFYAYFCRVGGFLKFCGPLRTF